ncbi:MAG: chorismate synthase [Halothermotrichaceae bacterium]
MVEFLTAGESHGKGLMIIVNNIPAGVEVNIEYINSKLARRQGGYGRGGRMKIETDQVEIISGIRNNKTLGSPVGFIIYNKDWENWQKVMSAEKINKNIGDMVEIKKDSKIKKIARTVTKPRPGHADLSGTIKYNHNDIRNILERASARETAARVAVGGLMDNFLDYFNIDIISHVIQLGEIKSASPDIAFDKLKSNVLHSKLGCFDSDKEEKMVKYIDDIKDRGDSLGGIIEIRTTKLPVGLGTHVQWKDRIDGLLAQALMSIPAVKGVEIGSAFSNSGKTGSNVHDEIYYDKENGYYRKTNRAGGVEGGMTNGEPLVVRMAMKPIPTLYKPLNSVDIKSKKPFKAGVERSDVTAVTAAGVVGEAMVSFVLAQALLNKFGGDSISEIMNNYNDYIKNYK